MTNSVVLKSAETGKKKLWTKGTEHKTLFVEQGQTRIITALLSLPATFSTMSSPVLPFSPLQRHQGPPPCPSPLQSERSGPKGNRMCHTTAMLCPLHGHKGKSFKYTTQLE